MKRVLAALAAVALVAVAVLVRDRLDEGGSPTGAAGGGGGGGGVLVCLAELAPACDALAARHGLEVRVEEAAVTAARLSRADLDPAAGEVAAWLTFRPDAAMVAEARRRAVLPPALGEPSPTLARSPLVVAVWADRAAALGPACGGAISWACVGERTGQPWEALGGNPAWGVLEPGHPTPDRTAAGLLVLAQASSSALGWTTYAANDLADPAFRAWFERLERGIPGFPTPPRTPLDDMLSLGPAAFDLAGSLEAAAGPAVARSRARQDLAILYPAPMAVAEVVLVPVAGAGGVEQIAEVVGSGDGAAALAAAGWRVEGQPLAEGIPADPRLTDGSPLPDGVGLPAPGVLEALRSLWLQVVR